MGCDTYSIMIGEVVIAKGMSIEHALIFIEALYNKYYNERSMKITIMQEPREWEKEEPHND